MPSIYGLFTKMYHKHGTPGKEHTIYHTSQTLVITDLINRARAHSLITTVITMFGQSSQMITAAAAAKQQQG